MTPKKSERDVCTKDIIPALQQAGWDIQKQIREEVTLTAGRVLVRGQMAKRSTKKKRADIVLYRKFGIPLAVIEAKEPDKLIGDGMQQALQYAEMLQVPFAFSSNGKAFLTHDKTGAGPTEQEIPMDSFPSPEDLWTRYCEYRSLPNDTQELVTQDYHFESGGKTPRYYQANAINLVLEAVARGQDRLLLVMATGSGKTYMAFQIMWRLKQARKVRRVLFLADRNVLVDQAKTGDFSPFGEIITKIQNRKTDKAFEIYMTLYQAISSPDDRKDVYKNFSKDFFDLVVIDECHRSSADETSAWHDILNYFSSATHLGLTATPKETKDVSNITYFGDPIYTYSLRQGIEDGFLAPYKVVKITMDRDLGWRPEDGKTDKYGEAIPDKEYTRGDYDKTLVLEKRITKVSEKVTQFLQATNPFDKTIIFCEDQEHASNMRSAITNANAELCHQNCRYVMRITGDDTEGKLQLDNFIDPESRYPVIATTSRLMSTGVDAQTCKLIVLDRSVNSMTEFKQIIGRGTRINEEYGKMFFTIMDFRNATKQFADPDFDGDPVVIFEPTADEPPVPPDDVIDDPDDDDFPDPPDDGDPMDDGDDEGDEGSGRRLKYYVNDVEVSVIHERIEYVGPDGRLITESLKDYTRKNVRQQYASLDAFLHRWKETDRKKAIVDELYEQGVFFDALQKEVGEEYGPFDLICHLAYDVPLKTRKERANKLKGTEYLDKYNDKAKAVLEALLDKYADEGMENIELDNQVNVLKLHPISTLGSMVELVGSFGNKKAFLEAVDELENALYEVA
jgi:type I restriction enzyme, R subunit